MKQLNITHFKQTGKALQLAIEDAVKDTQRVIIQPLPSELVMNATQFEDLQVSGGTLSEYMPDYFLYKTKLSIMEVSIK